MKVKIEVVEGIEEDEVVIRCGSLNDSVVSLQNYLSKQNDGKRCLALAEGETEFFIPMGDICFFETQGREIRAHTADKIFVCGYKLYELEELLPGVQVGDREPGPGLFRHAQPHGVQRGGIFGKQ